MKPTILKVWPEIEGYTPLLTSPSDASKSTQLFKIDFSECYTVDSCGLAAFLLKVLYHTKYFANNTSWICTGLDNDITLKDKIIKLQFFTPIINYHQESLAMDSEITLLNKEPIRTESFGTCKFSFPLVYIDFTDCDDRRETGEKLLKYILFERLKEYVGKYSINIMQFITILIEIVKNTADHTNANAVFGMDIIKIEDFIKINFFYGDLGDGIMEHIKECLKLKNDSRWEKLDITDVYHKACEKGYSTNLNSGKNFGMGMSTIIEFAKTMKMRLSVFDANSRGLLSEFDIPYQFGSFLKKDFYSHRILRRKFFNFSRRNPFCYYGTVEARQK